MNGPLFPQVAIVRKRRAFTIAELLTAMAVLLVLVVMTTQLISNALRATARSGKLMDADSQARLVFDRLAADLARFNRLGGMDSIFARSGGGTDPNDKMYFFSAGPGFYSVGGTYNAQDNSGLSLIGYRVRNTVAAQPKSLQLERLGKTLTWTGSYGVGAPGAPLLLSFQPGSFNVIAASTIGGAFKNVVGTAAGGYSDGADADFHVLTDQVFRFESCFLLSDGKMSNLPLRDRAAAPASGQPKWTVTAAPPTNNADASQGYTAGPAGTGEASLWFDNSTGAMRTYRCASAEPGAAVWVPGGLEGVSAIVVAIAVLDDASRALNVDATALARSLPNPSDDDLASSPPVTMSTRWNNETLKPGFASSAGIPPAAVSSLRVYQRIFYLNQ